MAETSQSFERRIPWSNFNGEDDGTNSGQAKRQGELWLSFWQFYIGGKWVEPASGQYFENITPITGRTFCQIPRSSAQDIEPAHDAAQAARERSRVQSVQRTVPPS